MREPIAGSNAVSIATKSERQAKPDGAAAVFPLSGERHETALARLGLLAIVVMVTAFSFMQSTTRSLWIDEIFTVQVSGQGGPAAIWNALQQAVDSNPPFYYLVARL